MIREVVSENSGDLSSGDSPQRNFQTRLFPRPSFPGHRVSYIIMQFSGVTSIIFCVYGNLTLSESRNNVIKILWQSHTI